jgi:hypothetical protein
MDSLLRRCPTDHASAVTKARALLCADTGHTGSCRLSAKRAYGSAIGRPLVLAKHGPWSNTHSICTAGYIYYHGLCQRVAPPPPGCGNPVTGTGTANTLTGGRTPAACPCAAGNVYSLGYRYPAH